jgi:hypothetical protein
MQTETFSYAPLLFRLDSIVVLVPFLFMRAPRGITIDHVSKCAGKDHEYEDQEDEWRHTVILYLLVYRSDTRLVFNEHGMVIFQTFHTLFLQCPIPPTVPLVPAGENMVSQSLSTS